MSVSPERIVISASILPRLIGCWLCLIALVGLVVVGIDAGPGAAAIVLLLWSAPGLWWGSRLIRFGVVADPTELIVRNLFRTNRLAYDEITDVRLQRRQRLVLFRRSAAVVEAAGRAQPIALQSTESLWWPAGLFTHASARTDRDVERIRAIWLDRRTRSS